MRAIVLGRRFVPVRPTGPCPSWPPVGQDEVGKAATIRRWLLLSFLLSSTLGMCAKLAEMMVLVTMAERPPSASTM